MVAAFRNGTIERRDAREDAELVDFTAGTLVDYPKLIQDAEALEIAVRRRVGTTTFAWTLRRRRSRNELDVAAELVRRGLARDCPRFSGGRYATVEREAAEVGAMIRETYQLPGYCRPRR